jgi:UDP-2,4-diacetamido-2,4,6-trideoxy-beta-L-altropyranose hydrolase
MTAKQLAVFRTAGSPALGHGHLHRCLALANALDAAGLDVAFTINDAAADTAAGLWGDRFQTLCIETGDGTAAPEDAGLNAEIARLKLEFSAGVDWLIIDHYQRGADFEATARGWAGNILALDDLRRHHVADIVVDAAPGRRPEDYAALAPDALRLCGPAYAFLKPGFPELRARGRAPAATTSTIPTLLISLGGTDPQGILPALLHALAPAGKIARILVTVSRAAASLERIRQAAEETGAILLVDHNDMPGLLSQVDIAIGAGGVSALERCCLGIPSLLLQVAENQADTINGLVEAGAAEHGEWPESPGTLVLSVIRLLKDQGRQAAMAAAGRRLCDGRGAARTAISITHPQFDRNGRRIHLRPVTEADTTMIFGWQCQPGVRQFSRVAEPPAWEEHLSWSQRMLARTDAGYNIILSGNEPVGVLRLEPRDGGHEVSILISSEFGGRGIASGALRLARHSMPDQPLLAFIKPENVASRTAFAKAGFKPFKSDEWYIALPGNAG